MSYQCLFCGKNGLKSADDIFCKPPARCRQNSDRFCLNCRNQPKARPMQYCSQLCRRECTLRPPSADVASSIDGPTARFEEAVQIAHHPPEGSKIPNDTKLYLYARYKQATLGEADSDRVSFRDPTFTQQKKLDAWIGVSGMSRQQAQVEYVEKLLELIRPKLGDPRGRRAYRTIMEAGRGGSNAAQAPDAANRGNPHGQGGANMSNAANRENYPNAHRQGEGNVASAPNRENTPNAQWQGGANAPDRGNGPNAHQQGGGNVTNAPNRENVQDAHRQGGANMPNAANAGNVPSNHGQGVYTIFGTVRSNPAVGIVSKFTVDFPWEGQVITFTGNLNNALRAFTSAVGGVTITYTDKDGSGFTGNPSYDAKIGAGRFECWLVANGVTMSGAISGGTADRQNSVSGSGQMMIA